ncbi:MliC family protein [Luteimonas qiangzhengi]|uniref:MliC family protein n=1 Tax=Luteimonas sp. MJ146 TaxID=3129240 RepID=UPI0031BB1713
MAMPGNAPFHRLLPLGALALALAACQPQAPVPEAAAPESAATPIAGVTPGERVNFQCGDLVVGATFDETGQNVRMSWSGQRMDLTNVVAASGALYADDAGNEFHTRGLDEAQLTLAGQERRSCVRADRSSPWDVAADKGVRLRGVGQEPGWLVEVSDGLDGEPALTAHLDYGQRLLEATGLESTADGYSGQSTDGTSVVLTVEERECNDPMSGEQFRAAVSLTVGGQEYQGCGAWLDAD